MKQSFHKKHNKKAEKGEGESSYYQTQGRGHRTSPHTEDRSAPRKSPSHTEGRSLPRKSPPTEAAALHEEFLHSEIAGDFPLPQQHTEEGDLSGASFISPEAPEGGDLYREFAQLEDRDLSIAAIQSDLQQSLLPLVKQELWYKIRYKRLSEGKEEFVPDDPKPPQQYELTEDERYKIEQRRLQNRQSAQRSRKRSEDNEQNLLQKISRLEKDNSKLLEEKEKLQNTKESILLEFNNIGCYPSIRVCSCGIRLKSGEDVSATETRGSRERDNGVTQQK